MSPGTDRIPVPTNGRGPHAPASPAAPAPPATPPAPVASAALDTEDEPPISDADLGTAFSPRQIAVGFGILASLVLLLAGLARRRGPGSDDSHDDG